jgi:hypothetical protein
MTSGVQTWGGQFIEISWGIPWPYSCLPGVLFGSRAFLALRWTVPEMILGEVASRCGFTWWLSLPTWGVDVDRLDYSLHRPTVCSSQTRGQGLLPGVVLSYRCSGWWRLLGDVKPSESRYFIESWPLQYLYHWILHGVNHFCQWMLIPWKSHHDI